MEDTRGEMKVRARTPFGQWLWATRMRNNWTFALMAEAVHVNASTLCRIERGGQIPRDDTIKKLADALAYPVDELRQLAGRPTLADVGVEFGTAEELHRKIYDLQHACPATRRQMEEVTEYLASSDVTLRGAAITALARGMVACAEDVPNRAYAGGILRGALSRERDPYVCLLLKSAVEPPRAELSPVEDEADRIRELPEPERRPVMLELINRALDAVFAKCPLPSVG